jgi:hypothetical protein
MTTWRISELASCDVVDDLALGRVGPAVTDVLIDDRRFRVGPPVKSGHEADQRSPHGAKNTVARGFACFGSAMRRLSLEHRHPTCPPLPICGLPLDPRGDDNKSGLAPPL